MSHIRNWTHIETAITFADGCLRSPATTAVGLRRLVRGLDAAKPALIERVLSSRRLELHPGARGDVKAGRIDV